MKKTTLIGINTLLFIYVLLSLGVIAGNAQEYELVWSDEFENKLNEDWIYEIGRGKNGWGNNELQYYRKENAALKDGNLVITAQKENYDGATYTSVRMKTQGKKSWKYGKIEARIKMPSFMGAWPAFWMLGDNISSVGWPNCGEIDIMEHVNTDNNAFGTVHYTDENNNYKHIGGNTTIDLSTFHTYTIEWNAQEIVWFIDDKQYHQINIENGVDGTSAFHKPFFIILNMAIGGNWPGFVIDDSMLPAQMYIDYVRVYQQANDITIEEPTTSVVIEAEDYTNMSGIKIENTTDVNGGKNVAYIDQSDWMSYSNVLNIIESGEYKIEYRIASLNGGTLSADLNSGTIQLGKIAIPSTGGWQNWETLVQNVTIDKGKYDFGVYAQEGGWNLNWIKITRLNTLSMTESVLDNGIEYYFYPNPVQSELKVKGIDPQKIIVLDYLGRKCTLPQSSNERLDMSVLPSGMYILTNQRRTFYKKIIKH